MSDTMRGRPGPPTHFGRTFLVGGTLVAGLLAGTWFMMLNYKKREQAAGKNPYHEQVVAGISRRMPKTEELKPMNAAYSEYPPAFLRSEHYNGHMTNADARKLDNFKSELRYREPTPQRHQLWNVNEPYTKSPDFAKNYGKTEKARTVVLHPQHQV